VDLSRTTTKILPNLLWFPIYVLSFYLVHLLLRRKLEDVDPLLLPLVALLTGVGLVILYRLSPDLATTYRTPGHRLLMVKQLIWTAVGLTIGLLGVVYLLTDERLKALGRLRYIYVIFSVLLIVITARFGVEVNNRKLWLKFGPIMIQSVEIVKIALIFFIAGYFRERRQFMGQRRFLGLDMPEGRHALPFIILCGLSLSPLFFQKDFGPTMLLLATFLAMFYVGSGSRSLVLFGVLFATLTVFILYKIGFPAMLKWRMLAWLHPFERSEHITQSLWALSSGGFFGLGLGSGLPQYIPTVQSDFNFAAICEEMGYLGGMSVLLVYVVLLIRGFRIALNCSDLYKKLLGTGLMTLFAFQTFLILAGVTSLFLLTGITLPFVSYGGSSMVISFGLIGLLLNISS